MMAPKTQFHAEAQDSATHWLYLLCIHYNVPPINEHKGWNNVCLDSKAIRSISIGNKFMFMPIVLNWNISRHMSEFTHDFCMSRVKSEFTIFTHVFAPSDPYSYLNISCASSVRNVFSFRCARVFITSLLKLYKKIYKMDNDAPETH